MAGGLIVLEEHRRINPKAFCDPSNIIDGHVTLGPFDGAEVRAVDPAFMCQSFLTEATRSAEPTHVLRQDVSQGPFVRPLHER